MPYLRTLRHRRGLTILEIARRSGLTARAIAELEYGLRPHDTAERVSLARSSDLDPGRHPALRWRHRWGAIAGGGSFSAPGGTCRWPGTASEPPIPPCTNIQRASQANYNAAAPRHGKRDPRSCADDDANR